MDNEDLFIVSDYLRYILVVLKRIGDRFFGGYHRGLLSHGYEIIGDDSHD